MQFLLRRVDVLAFLLQASETLTLIYWVNLH